MELINIIKKVWKTLEKSGLPSYVWTSDKLAFWRERVLFIIIVLVVLFGTVLAIPMVGIGYLEGDWLIAGLDVLAWFSAIFILYHRNIPIAYRTWTIYFIFYVFGITFLHSFGLNSAGHIWFFRGSIIVGVMLGMRHAIVAVFLNSILLIFVAVLILTGSSAWVSQDTNALRLWFVVMANFMITNTIITFVVVLLLDGIDKLLFESRETVNTLRESEEKLKGTFEASPDPMVVYDTKGHPQYINSAFVEVFGWTMEELAGKPIPFIPDDQKDICRQQINALFDAGNIVELETTRLTKHGKIINVLLKAALIKGPDGRPKGTIVNLADITESKKLEKQLRQARKMEAIGTLAGGIAHDFNNILQIISGYADITIMDKDKGSSDHANLQVILDAAGRAAKLIRQLLLFSRKVDTATKILNPNQEIRQVVNILSRTIPKMIRIQTDLSENLWNIKADPVQIEQVILNLGSNAADAMPSGGTLTIRTVNIRINSGTTNDLADMRPGDYVLITVSDTGCGMEKDIVEHIFEPFFTTKDVGEGTGLGLASVYGIVIKHRGYITCQSRPGKGTQFKIYMPAVDKTEGIIEDIEDTATLTGGTETILIVDDEATIRGFSSKALGYFGYSVMECSNGEQAIDIYQYGHNDIDLILLDIGMPGMGGYKCFEKLLAFDPEARVLIATGYNKDENMTKVLEKRAAGYLGKPYKLSVLLKSVRKALDNKP